MSIKNSTSQKIVILQC